jgi:eukaryotic-like serine/threonine-protein kinase
MTFLLTDCDPDRLRLLVEDRLSHGETIELEQHLEKCSRCRETLDDLVGKDQCLEGVRRFLRPEPDELDETGLPTAESLYFLAPSDWPDSIGRLGSYEVKGILGRGGMGVVVKAFDPALHRNVAIKVLSASLASTGAARSRFLREARAAAAVVHEHVVGVFAVAEAAGLPFLVMEYVSGRSLQDRLDRDGPLSITEVLRIGMQTASGLAAAHAQGLVHRDVKPANILLENSVERVRLTDFGLARAVADAGLSHSGVVAGTPYYMAPEQARGETTDHRADLFSLGSTLYATCAGYPPFRAETPLAVLRRVCDDNPRPLREINPQVPSWLEALIARLMAKEPSERFQTADEAFDVLERCLAHVQQPLTSPLPSELESRKLRRVLRMVKRPAAALISITLLTTLGAAAIGLRSHWNHRTPERAFRPEPSDSADALGLGQRHAGPAVDEIQRLIEASRLMAQQTAGDLFRSTSGPANDPIEARGDTLLKQAQAIEREILSDRSSRSGPYDSFPSVSPDNRR